MLIIYYSLFIVHYSLFIIHSQLSTLNYSTMTIFVINAGSSSIKYQLFKMPDEHPVCSGLVERIGLENSVITHKVYKDGVEEVVKQTIDLPDHEAGLKEVAHLLTDKQKGVIQNPGEIAAVGHRVVHGGESFAATVVIDEKIKEEIKKLFPLAPLHNPANYTGIEVAEKIFANAKQVAVFDTAFHQSMPEKAFRYAIPNNLYTNFHIRVYGFHGTNHKYVSEKAAAYLQNPTAKIISIHLGNGCSMAAVNAGKSVDTSMGFGPLSGLVMGTRSGDIDASVIFHLADELGYDISQVKDLLNKQSGLTGLAGFSDMRDILKQIEKGDQQAVLARNIYAYRIQKYIGAYAAVLNGIDAVVFTGGVGENDADMRWKICENINFLGIIPDREKNRIRSADLQEISADASPVKILVVQANEELEIAQQCFGLLKS